MSKQLKDGVEGVDYHRDGRGHYWPGPDPTRMAAQMPDSPPALRPCAHCGGAPALRRTDIRGAMGVYCVECESSSSTIAAWNRRAPTFDPTNETQVAALALASFELERDYWDSAEFSQHESRLREWARVTLGKLRGGG